MSQYIPRFTWPILAAIALIVTACASPEPVAVEVTREVEVEVVREVEVTRQVEVVHEVEVTPVPGRCAPTDVAEVDMINIGAAAPLSAPGSVTGGLAMQAAFNIAVDDINAAGGVLGKPINVILYDTEGLPERGTTVAEQLITQECVVAIVGEYHSAVGLATKEVSHKYHIPTVFSEPYHDDITGVEYPEVFRIAPTSTFTAQMDAKWLSEVGDYNGDGRVFTVIVAENNDYGTGQVQQAETWFPEFGIELETFFADVPTQDFAPIIARILALDTVPDAILIKVETSYALQQQLYEDGVDISQTIVVASQAALNYEEYWENVPDGAYAAVPRIGPLATSASDIGLEFAEKYSNVMTRFPEAYAFEAYDSLHLIADAIERAGSLDPDEIIAALEATDLELAAGHYYFPYGINHPPEDDGQPAFMWHQWPEVPLLYLQYTAPNQTLDDVEVIWPEAYRTTEGPIVRPGE